MKITRNHFALCSCCALMAAAIPAHSQAPKRTLHICSSDIQIGSSLRDLQAVFADADSSCKLLHLDGENYAVMTAAKLPKDSEQLGYVTFEDGQVSVLERTLRIEGDANTTAFKFFHLLQDFENSGNTKCTISSFKNGSEVGVFNGTQLICGNRSLKLVSVDFDNGQRGIDVTEAIRK